MSNIHYLDHASTSYPTKYFAKDSYVPGNPNSNHALGLQANQALNEARQRIMDCLGVKSGKVLVGGTASQLVDNLMWRIYSLGNYNILGSVYEHDCFNRWLDYRLTEYPTDQISKSDIVCWMMVNNITGTVFNVEEIGSLCHKYGAYYIMDATAAIGHHPIPADLESFCDCIITSGHKYHAETGFGFMWLSDRFSKFLGLSDDSHEEFGLLHGTTNVPGAIALSYAVEHAVEAVPLIQDRWQNLTFHLQRMLSKNGVECDLVCNDSPKTYAINALYLPNINADALTQYLSSKSIYISPGHSACADNDDYRVLEAFGLTKKQASQTVRISFGEETTQEDIDALVNGIVEFKELFV